MTNGRAQDARHQWDAPICSTVRLAGSFWCDPQPLLGNGSFLLMIHRILSSLFVWCVHSRTFCYSTAHTLFADEIERRFFICLCEEKLISVTEGSTGCCANVSGIQNKPTRSTGLMLCKIWRAWFLCRSRPRFTQSYVLLADSITTENALVTLSVCIITNWIKVFLLWIVDESWF